MDDKHKLLADQLNISNLRMERKETSPEKQQERKTLAEELKQELGISTELPYAPEFYVEVLTLANDILFGVKDWANQAEVYRRLASLLDEQKTTREKNMLEHAVKLVSAKLHHMGQQFYREETFPAAEYVYRLLERYALDLRARVQLAAMIRRGEVKENPSLPPQQPLRLLHLPARQGDPIALANLALYTAGQAELSQKEWLEAIGTWLSRLTPTGVYEVSRVWQNLARDGDPEGYLLHLLLLTCGKLSDSPLGDTEHLLEVVGQAFPEIKGRFYRFLVIGDSGKEIECDILFIVERNQKEYIAYTDDTLDEEGNIRIYASILDMASGAPQLLPIESDEEWEMIETLLDDLQETYGGDTGQT